MVVTTSFRRTWIITLVRALISVIGCGLVSLVIYVVYYGGRGELGWAHVPYALFATAATMVIPLTWALFGGAMLDHWLAPRGPQWALVIHPLGLAAVGFVFMVKFIGLPDSRYLDVFAFFVGVPAVVGFFGVLLTWLIPGSFPRKRGARNVTWQSNGGPPYADQGPLQPHRLG